MALYKPIQGYEELYLVSSDGDIIALPRIVDNGYRKAHRKQHKMKQKTCAGVYKCVMLSKNGERKAYSVHRLVAQKYVPNPENKPQVNHIDGDKLNNHYTNLEWVTNAENRKHATVTGLQWSKLTLDEVRYIKQHKDIKTRELADKFGVTRHCINKIKAGINFKNIQ